MSPGYEQLLFGSVDLVVDGQERSGWQVIQQSEGLDDASTSQLVRLVVPELTPLHPLSGFPTPEEVKAADRRLVHRTVGGFPALFHTAPAGQDTTGRPNTMTHVVVDRSGTTTRPLLGANAWRAEWWCTPFGPEQMRQAQIPPAELLRAGSSVTPDSVLELVLRPGAAAVLGALADVVASNAENSDPDERRVAVLLVEDVDEAAQWLGALLSTTAAEPARAVSWSTLERVHGERDLERLMHSGLDIAAVPRADLTEQLRAPARCIIVDPSQPPANRPSTPFGRLVVSMAMDPGLWLMVHESMQNDVLAQLIDHSGVTLAWPAAMAQALGWARGASDGVALFGAISDGALRSDVEESLLQATVPALELELPGMTDALQDARELVVQGVDERGPAGWRELCRRIGGRVSEDRAVMLGRRYLTAAVRDAAWLRGERAAAPPLPDSVRNAVHRWSSRTASMQEVRDLVGTAVATIEPGAPGTVETDAPRERSLAWGYLATWLLEDGLSLDGECLAALLEPLATILLEPVAAGRAAGEAQPDLAQLVSRLPKTGNAELARQLERGLAELAFRTSTGASSVLQPVLNPAVALALGSHPSSAEPQPWLRLQIALAGIAAGSADSSSVLSALSALTGGSKPPSASLRLRSEATLALDDLLLPENLPMLEQLSANGSPDAARWMLIAALRDPAAMLSARYLSARRRSNGALAAVKSQMVTPSTWEESAVLLGDAVTRPFLTGTMPSDIEWSWAENSLTAAVHLREGMVGIHASRAFLAMLGDLSRTVALRAMGALIVLTVAEPPLAARGMRHRVELTDLVAEAAESPGRLFSAHSMTWGEACLKALKSLTAEDLGALPSEELATAAAAVLDARLRAAPDDAASALISEARSVFRGDPQGWARAQQIVPALEDRRVSRIDRLGDIVKKNLNMLPWQKKEGRDG